MSFLDTLIYGYRTIKAASVAVTQRNTLNFSSGFSVTDNPSTGATDVAATGAFGANNVTLNAGQYVGVGSNLPTAGAVRLANTQAVKFRNAANSADATAFQYSASDYLFIGSDSSYTTQAPIVVQMANTSLYLGIGSTFYVQFTGGNVEYSKPITGSATYSSQYGVHGRVSHTFAADANYTVTAAQYAYDYLRFVTGSWTIGRTVTFPHAATDAVSYDKTIYNNTTVTMTISTGTGTTKTLATGLAQRFNFSSAGVQYASATFTP